MYIQQIYFYYLSFINNKNIIIIIMEDLMENQLKFENDDNFDIILIKPINIDHLNSIKFIKD